MDDTRQTDPRTETRLPARGEDRELLAYLHGELDEPAARALEERLDREPALMRRLRTLEGTWEALELPPVAPPPLGFAARVAARATAAGAPGDGAGAFRPAWVRVAGAAVLAAGIGAGAGLGWLAAPDRVPGAEASSVTTTVDELTSTTVPTLAEAYWSAFDDELGDGEEVR